MSRDYSDAIKRPRAGVFTRSTRTWMSHPRRKQKEKERRAVPDLHTLLDARDYTGAITLVEFNRKLFFDAKHASGWQARTGAAGFDWVEGKQQQLTDEEHREDEQERLWMAYAAFHLGDFKKALATYQSMIDTGSNDQMIHVYMGCCLLGLGWHAEAEERAAARRATEAVERAEAEAREIRAQAERDAARAREDAAAGQERAGAARQPLP